MDRYFDLNQQTYDWCVRAFDQVRKVLGVQIKMHHGHRQIDNGDIFLYNHFSRVETFIPQYLIYHETGEFCRSIAAAEFFKGSDRFANALRDLGVVPNDHPHLMELLATDILKGRKIVVFPEGGMVKDRQVVVRGQEVMSLSGGFESGSEESGAVAGHFNGVHPIIADEVSPSGVMFYLQFNTWRIYETHPPELITRGGGVLHQYEARGAYQFRSLWRAAQFTVAPTANGVRLGVAQ